MRRIAYPQENEYTNFDMFVQWNKLNKKKRLLIHSTIFINLMAIILYENINKNVIYTLYI